MQQVLADPSPQALEEQVEQLKQAARDVDARRITPYAAALTAWASDHPGDLGTTALRLARELDPALPATEFVEARWQWLDGRRLASAKTYLWGWYRLLRSEPTRRSLVASTGVWLILAAAAACLTVLLLQTVRFVRLMAHDAFELGMVLFSRPNAVVFATVLLLLPLFAALGPVWLLAYLFTLSWAYLQSMQRAAAIGVSFSLALLLPALDLWQQAALRTPHLKDRVAMMLEHRCIDPSTLQELVDLEPEFDGSSLYHLILGELLRMHGDRSDSFLQFEKGALADPENALAYVFLGNHAMENGDVSRAVQRYTTALDLDPSNALVYYNLSYGYDQTYLFQQGDQARAKARELSGRRPESLGVGGRISRVRYPWLRATDMDRLLDEATPEDRLATDFPKMSLRPLELLLTPTSTVFWVTALVGSGLLAARHRWMWASTACSRCGRVFCPRCKSSTESASYCSQCTSVFLKRDGVSIEQQTAKRAQIRRWELMTAVARRLVGVLVPGGTAIMEDRLWKGISLALLMWLLLIGGLVWLPLYVVAVEPQVAVLPIQIVMLAMVAALWLRSAFVAMTRR